VTPISYPSLFVLLALVLWLPPGYRAVFAVAGGLLVWSVSIPSAWRKSMGPVTGERRLAHLVCAGGPLVLAVLLYHQNTAAWWMHDDPAILRHVIEYPLLENVFDSDTWRSYSASNLTPLLLLSFGLDYVWFGVDPWGYYAHQLVVLLAILATGYGLLLRWLPPAVAMAVLMAFAASLPVATLIQELMTRHYLEGLLLILWSFMLFLRGLETQNQSLSWLAALLYLLACSAKEIYVPLLAVLPFLPLGQGWRQRLVHVVPFVIAAGAYTLWRLYMLKPENVISGYGSLYQAAPAGLGDTWHRLLTGLGWHDGLLVLMAFTTPLAVWALVRQKNRWGLTALAVTMALILAPLVPVLAILSARNLMLLSGLAAILTGIGLAFTARNSDQRRQFLVAPLALAWVGLSVGAVANSQVWGERAYLERFRSEGQFILEGDTTRTLLTPIGPSWYYSSLAWIREHSLEQGRAPAVCYQPCLCPPEQLADSVSYGVEGLSPSRANQDSCDVRDAPLSVQAVYDPDAGVLQWKLGPYNDGQWFYLLTTGAAPAPLPRSGHTPIHLPHALKLRVMYEAPSGWKTGSAMLHIDPEDLSHDGKVHIRWQRAKPLIQ